MNVTWNFLFSYDAEQEFYRLKSPRIVFDLDKSENIKMRVNVILMLLLAGATHVKSSVGSTILFQLQLDNLKITEPINYLVNIIDENFDKNDLGYMVQVTNSVDYRTISVERERKKSHLIHFNDDLIKAKELVPKVKFVS